MKKAEIYETNWRRLNFGWWFKGKDGIVLDGCNLVHMWLYYGEEHAYLNSCSNNDAHEEVGDNASNCHH